MAINMRDVKKIEFNNKIVKVIEDANGNIMWQYNGFYAGVKASPVKILTEIMTGLGMYQNPLYWTINQLSSAVASTSSSSSASNFYLFTENQILALLDDDFDFDGDGMYNNEFIGGVVENGYFSLQQPYFLDSSFYIAFIQNNQLYFVGNKTTNTITDGGLLGYTDDYTNAYLFYVSNISSSYGRLDAIKPVGSSLYVDNRNTLKYRSSNTTFATYSVYSGTGDGIIPYQSITNPNANN